VLKNFTKAVELETLKGNLKESQARKEAEEERVKHLQTQVDLARKDLEYCVVKAEKGGMVVYPTAEPWKRVPEIEVGANVYMGQTLLLMPDLTQMQVKVGIPETNVDHVKPGMAATITLPDRTLDGEVFSVASVTGPAGWWNGNKALYDAIIKLPQMEGLKPGMSAVVEIITAQHQDVLTAPVAAVIETGEEAFCWVKTSQGAQRRSLQLGDTNDVFTVVEEGLAEGEQVVLNPLAFPEAKELLLKAKEEIESAKTDSGGSAGTSKSSGAQTTGDEKRKPSKPKADKPQPAGSKGKASAAEILKLADKNKDGVLTVDEFAEKDRKKFELVDTNKDGKVEANELDAALNQAQKAKP
jgi:hypothetical protein